MESCLLENLPAFRSLGLLVTKPLSRRLTRIFMSFGLLQLDQLGYRGTMRRGNATTKKRRERDGEMPSYYKPAHCTIPNAKGKGIFPGKIVKEKTEGREKGRSPPPSEYLFQKFPRRKILRRLLSFPLFVPCSVHER